MYKQEDEYYIKRKIQNRGIGKNRGYNSRYS